MLRPTIYTLTSPLHDHDSVEAESVSFLRSIEELLGYPFDVARSDFSDFGSRPVNFIFVRTGGTEGLFKDVCDRLGDAPVRLLTSGRSNSLAASMEILSFLRQHGRTGEIIHGTAETIARSIASAVAVEEAAAALRGASYGVIGRPSDWLVASAADADAVRSALGVELVDIEMEELFREISASGYPPEVKQRLKPLGAESCQSGGKISAGQFEGALGIYGALKRIVARHGLSGFTLRCFDLLGPVGNTGCLGLALLNSEGIVAGCEGDVPAMLSMAVSRALTGSSGFQSNPSRIDASSGEMLFAHCTIPLDMLRSYSYDTHFESGIGVAIRGEMDPGDVTLFKIAGDMSRYFVCEGTLVKNLHEKNLCRTQLLLHTSSGLEYFLSNPIGNHHIILKGHHASLIRSFMTRCGIR